MLDRLLTELPEVVRALAEPLTKVDKITVISTGPDGQGTGTCLNRVTADMASVIAQVPALLESLTGVRIDDLLKQVPATGGGNGRARSSTAARTPGQNGSAERVEAEPVSGPDEAEASPVSDSVKSDGTGGSGAG